jgi:hypothetical protein
MKKFQFPLQRVLDWREVQARLEESKLEALYSERTAIDSEIATLLEERERSDRAVAQGNGSTGEELAALSAFRRFSVAEHTRLDRLRAGCSQRIAAQIVIVTSKRRDAKLLQKLEQQRLAAWQIEFSKHIDAQAEESHIARWNARH